MKGRSFLTLLDYTPDEIRKLLDLAAKVKEEKKNGASLHGNAVFSKARREITLPERRLLPCGRA